MNNKKKKIKKVELQYKSLSIFLKRMIQLSNVEAAKSLL